MKTPQSTLHAFTALAFTGAFAIGTSQAALWTPSETTTALWFDASDASSVTESGGAVSQWDDKSGNKRHATQATAANQPSYVSAGQNGLNVIRLDGSDDFLNLGTGLDWMAGTSHVAFAMLKNDNYVDLYGAANGSAGSGSLHVGFRLDTAGISSYRINYWGNDSYPAITTNYDAGEHNFVRWVWPDGSPKEVYANAQLEGTNGPNAGTISTMAGGGRISNVVGHGYLDADLAELIFVDGVPDAATTDRIEGYLAWKWGEQAKLPAGHAYENQAPQSLVPEPGACSLAGLAGLMLLFRRRR